MIDLSKFCDPKRPNITKPWSAGEYTYATNGMIGIRVARRDDVTSEDGPDLQAAMDAAPPATNMQPVPPFSAPPMKPCKDCGGHGVTIPCEQCDGTDSDEFCECGHETNCDDCDGSGQLNVTSKGHADAARAAERAIDCENCDGKGDVEDRNAWLQLSENLWLNPYLLAQVAALPGVLIDIADQSGKSYGDAKPVRFTFDGGIGVIMPMRAPSSSEYVHVIDLREKVAA